MNINFNHTLITNCAYLWPVTEDIYLYPEPRKVNIQAGLSMGLCLTLLCLPVCLPHCGLREDQDTVLFLSSPHEKYSAWQSVARLEDFYSENFYFNGEGKEEMGLLIP